jgi:hypothetical protein
MVFPVIDFCILIFLVLSVFLYLNVYVLKERRQIDTWNKRIENFRDE